MLWLSGVLTANTNILIYIQYNSLWFDPCRDQTHNPSQLRQPQYLLYVHHLSSINGWRPINNSLNLNSIEIVIQALKKSSWFPLITLGYTFSYFIYSFCIFWFMEVTQMS
jgi:hypothetical protein